MAFNQVKQWLFNDLLLICCEPSIEEAIIPAIGYRLLGPVDGGIGPRQEALTFATGWSLSGHQTVSSPLV
jgi:hypothetical protein